MSKKMEQGSLLYDYTLLLGMIEKYDMNEYDTKVVVGIVSDYLENNVRW